MCLKVKRVRKTRANSKGFRSAWKVVDQDNKSPFYWSIENEKVHTYKIGENVDIHFNKEWLTKVSISTGLHLLLSKGGAKGLIKNTLLGLNTLAHLVAGNKYKVIQVFYKEEDVIGYGINDFGKPFPCVAVKKLTIQSLDDISKEE